MENEISEIKKEIKKILTMTISNSENISDLVHQNSLIVRKLDLLSKSREIIAETEKFITEKKCVTKKELFEQFNINTKNSRLWDEIKDKLVQNENFDIHSGTGRSETIIIYLNSGSNISLASKMFKLCPRGKDLNVGFIMEKLGIEQERAKEVLDIMVKTFKGRIKVGMGLFKRIY